MTLLLFRNTNLGFDLSACGAGILEIELDIVPINGNKLILLSILLDSIVLL